jgi:hypothetical protein
MANISLNERCDLDPDRYGNLAKGSLVELVIWSE